MYVQLADGLLVTTTNVDFFFLCLFSLSIA